jgi:hypothetical protein
MGFFGPATIPTLQREVWRWRPQRPQHQSRSHIVLDLAATTPRSIASCALLELPVRAWRARLAAESRRGLLHARNGSGTRRGPLGSSLWGHAGRGGCRQPRGSEGIAVQGSILLDHARPSLIASCDTAGGLPAAGCHEEADSGSSGDVPVGARRAERSRAITRWCADRLTALLTATLTDRDRGAISSVDNHAGNGLRAPATHRNTHSNTHRPSSRPCGWKGSVGATPGAVPFPSSLTARRTPRSRLAGQKA